MRTVVIAFAFFIAMGDLRAEAPIRLFLHFSDATATSRDSAMEIALLLQAQGFEVVELRSIEAEMGRSVEISRPAVRYFERRFEADARTLQRELAAILRARGLNSAVRLQDFTHYSPKPPDALEVWLASPQ
jgi:hypothetical protein